MSARNFVKLRIKLSLIRQSQTEVTSDQTKIIMCLFKKKLSLFREVAIFRDFWFRTSCMDYVNCESVKDLVRMCLFEKKLSLFCLFCFGKLFKLGFLYHAIPVFLEFISVTPPLPVPSPE